MTTLSLLGGSHALTTVADTGFAGWIGTVSVAIVGAAAVMLIALVVAMVIAAERWPRFKAPLFTLSAVIVTTATLALAGTSIAANLNSPTGGPVSWGADYQIWACNNQMDLRDPHGLVGSRIGSANLYEQNDGHIHYNGVPSALPDDVSLGKFIQVVGGELSDNTLIVPINDPDGFTGSPSAPEQIQSYISTNREGASARFINGQTCGDQQAEVQAFAYTYNPATKTYAQTKLIHPASYELSHAATSPPGDCVIIEFAPRKERTDHLCPSYGVRDYERCTQYGVPADKIATCDIRELR